MSEMFELLMRRHQGKDFSIGTMPAGATLSEALRTLADAVEGAVGDGCQLIDSWGIGFQFRQAEHLYDLRLVSHSIDLRCFYRAGEARPEVETQEAKRVVVPEALTPSPPFARIRASRTRSTAGRGSKAVKIAPRRQRKQATRARRRARTG